ncbi:MAG TPA: DnaA N-terminal domain-containing protein, partial [Pyrinomonadaceae bacterium]|nr:DnaA N-terminal domain-containing protein [Pyrinomonadaceae bacterium]
MDISLENKSTDKDVWGSILQSMEKRLNRHIFDAWFRPVEFEGCDESERVLRLRASQVTKDWINTNYSEAIGQIMKEL